MRFEHGSSTGPETARVTSVHPLETTTHCLAVDSRLQAAVHRPVLSDRRAIIRAMADGPEESHQRRRARLEACCLAPMLAATEGGMVRCCWGYCRDRLCPTCQRLRGRDLARKCEAAISRMDAPRLLTLTLAHRPDGLGSELRRLGEAFRKLRRLDGWKRRVRGGAWSIEVTWSERTESWHAHLHVIVDGEFFPQRVLSEMWRDVTGDSYIVDVRAISSRARAAKYVATYVAKPAGLAQWPGSRIREFATATVSRRLYGTFGSVKNAAQDDDSLGESKQPVRLLCSLARVNSFARAGDAEARQARELILRMHLCDIAISRDQRAPLHRCQPPIQDWEVQRLTALLDAIRLRDKPLVERQPGMERRDPTAVLTPDRRVQLQLQWCGGLRPAFAGSDT